MQKGQSIIEILVAVGVGALLVIAAAGIIAPVLRANTQANQAQVAAALGKEFSDNIHVWAEGDWHNVLNLATSSANPYYLNTNSSPFTALAGSEGVVVSGISYGRYFYVDDVQRDTSGNIVSSGGSNDPSTKKITVAYRSGGNGAIGSWSTTAALNAGTLFDRSGLAYNGYIYTTGGFNAAASTTVLFAPVNSAGLIGTWSSTTKLPNALDEHSAIVYGGYMYATGGDNGTFNSPSSTVYYAPINSDGSVGAWSTTTKLPSAIDAHSAVVYNGYIYTTGGWNGSVATSTVFYAHINSDGSVGAWSTTTKLPSILMDHSAVVYNRYIYTTGGDNGAGTVTSTVFYSQINADGSVGAWNTTTRLPSILINHSAVAYNGYIYTTGGDNGAGTVTSTVFYSQINADGSVGSWNTATRLPSAIKDHSAVVYNGYIYTEAGRDSGSVATSTVFYAPVAVAANASVSSSFSFYVTRNRNNVLDQTDWSGGFGQNGPATTTNNQFSTSTTNIYYTSITGSVMLNLTGVGITIASDSFTRSNSSTLGSNWSIALDALAEFGISSNHAQVVNSGDFTADYWNANTFSNDQFSKVTFVSNLPDISGMVFVRGTTTVMVATAYEGGFNPGNFGDSKYRIIREVNGQPDVNLATSSQVAVLNDTVELDAKGTTLTLKVNGVTLLTVADTAIAAGVPGIAAGNNSINTAVMDDWSGGNL